MPRRCLLASLTIAAIALASTGAVAAPRLNDTGIDFCIDAEGEFIDCHGTGQDATTGRDVAHRRDADGRLGFRFTRLCNSGERAGEGSCPAQPPAGDAPDEWGCTRDEVTRLLWETKTASGHRDGSLGYTFYSPEYDPDGQYGSPTDLTGFLGSVQEAGLCGTHAWRLPTPAELMGIADMSVVIPPAIDLRFFPNTQANFYWSAGQALGFQLEKELAWGSDFLFGLGAISAQFRSGARPVRLVHGGGQAGKRYVVSPDEQEVTDRRTGLTWRRCVEGRSFNGAACQGAALEQPWIDTLAHARRQARQTGVAWRLPNLKEVASLLDHEQRLHVDIVAFPGANLDVLWTSSSFPTDPTPRCVSFPQGGDFACSQGAGGFGARLVRDRD
jgi:hypothetical protein